jgi:hypothetical protein
LQLTHSQHIERLLLLEQPTGVPTPAGIPPQTVDPDVHFVESFVDAFLEGEKQTSEVFKQALFLLVGDVGKRELVLVPLDRHLCKGNTISLLLKHCLFLPGLNFCHLLLLTEVLQLTLVVELALLLRFEGLELTQGLLHLAFLLHCSLLQDWQGLFLPGAFPVL